MKIALLYPGDMGGSIAEWVMAKSDHIFFTNLDSPERSARTKRLAQSAGVLSLPDDHSLLRGCDLIVSILRPDRAVEVGTRIAGIAATLLETGSMVQTKYYWDLNAISPSSAKQIEAAFSKGTNIGVIDGGIIGGPASIANGTFPSTVISGSPHAVAFVESIFRDVVGKKLQVVGGEVGQASALKLSYASLTKGFLALSFNSLSLANSHGVLNHLAEELASSQPGFARIVDRALGNAAAKAFRFEGEMKEISQAMGEIGLEGGRTMYEGAAGTYSWLKNTEVGRESIEQAREKRRSWRDVIEVVGRDLQSHEQ